MKNLIVGSCKDIVKAIAFFQGLPQVNLIANHRSNILVHLEELFSEENAKTRFDELNKLTRLQKENLINEVNPDWVELKIGINIEL